MKKIIIFTLFVFSTIIASANSNDFENILVNTSWTSTYYETDEGYEEPFDDVIVFHKNGTYTLYSVEHNFKPIIGHYLIDGETITMNHGSLIVGTFKVVNDKLTIDYMYTDDGTHVIDNYEQIHLSDVENIVNEKRSSFEEYLSINLM